jgi:hypothetical protein
VVRVLEGILKRDAEDVGDLEGHLQGRRIPALLDGNNSLAGDTHAFGKFGLGHFAAFEAQAGGRNW